MSQGLVASLITTKCHSWKSVVEMQSSILAATENVLRDIAWMLALAWRREEPCGAAKPHVTRSESEWQAAAFKLEHASQLSAPTQDTL